MHGFLTLSMLVHLIEQTIEITGAKMGVNYGFDKIRFVLPVLSNSKIRLNVKINKVEDIENGIKIFWDVLSKIHHQINLRLLLNGLL